MRVHALSEPRHTCLGCGGSCHGVVVRLTDDERARVEGFAAELGVPEPVLGDRLRQDHGRCVFLDGDGCRIHARWGAEAKPRICRQYPIVLVEADEARIGVDPGCYTASRTRSSGEPVALDGLAPSPAPLEPDDARAEATLLALSRDATVDALLARLAAPGVRDRWLARVKAPRLEALARSPDAGAHLRDALLPVLARARELDAPPPGPLAEPLDRWAVEVARRMLFLRLARSLPTPAVMLLTLLAAEACGWSTHDPQVFAVRLAGWTRALRAPPFVAALLPDPEALRRLVTGR